MPRVVAEYRADLLQRLQDPDYAAEYLSDCFDEGPEVFLLAMCDVVEAMRWEEGQ